VAAALIKYRACILAQAAMAAAAAQRSILAQQLPELMGLVVVVAVLAADWQVVVVQAL